MTEMIKNSTFSGSLEPSKEPSSPVELGFSWWDKKQGCRAWVTLGFFIRVDAPASWESLDLNRLFGPLDAGAEKRARRLESRFRKRLAESEFYSRDPQRGSLWAGACLSLSWALARAGCLPEGEWGFGQAELKAPPLFFEGSFLDSAVVKNAIDRWARSALGEFAMLHEESVEEVWANTKRKAFEQEMASLKEREILIQCAENSSAAKKNTTL